MCVEVIFGLTFVRLICLNPNVELFLSQFVFQYLWLIISDARPNVIEELCLYDMFFVLDLQI